MKIFLLCLTAFGCVFLITRCERDGERELTERQWLAAGTNAVLPRPSFKPNL